MGRARGFPLPPVVELAVAGDITRFVGRIIRVFGCGTVRLHRVGSRPLEGVGGQEGEVVVRPGCPVRHVVALRAEGIYLDPQPGYVPYVLPRYRFVRLAAADGVAGAAARIAGFVDRPGLPAGRGLGPVALHAAAREGGEGRVETPGPARGVVGTAEGNVPGCDPEAIFPRPCVCAVVVVLRSRDDPAVAGGAVDGRSRAVEAHVPGVPPLDVRVCRAVGRVGVAGGAVRQGDRGALLVAGFAGGGDGVRVSGR